MEKDKKEIQTSKSKLIEEIKSIDKEKMFATKPKEKLSIINKILITLGWKKKERY